MKLLLIRHGDPDYINDSLTKKGVREAELLAKRIGKMKIDECFVSPLGRAQATAAPSLKALGMAATTCDWMEEFAPTIYRPDAPGKKNVVWDWLPQDWTKCETFYDYRKWYDNEIFASEDIKSKAEHITRSFDAFLAEHGYVREGHYYRAEKPNNNTIAIFSHFGCGCILIGHLIGVSPMVLWHGLCAAPTSVTTIATEERRKGISSFRVLSYGDTSHLYAENEPPAFAARFCECYGNEGERID